MAIGHLIVGLFIPNLAVLNAYLLLMLKIYDHVMLPCDIVRLGVGIM